MHRLSLAKKKLLHFPQIIVLSRLDDELTRSIWLLVTVKKAVDWCVFVLVSGHDFLLSLCCLIGARARNVRSESESGQLLA